MLLDKCSLALKTYSVSLLLIERTTAESHIWQISYKVLSVNQSNRTCFHLILMLVYSLRLSNRIPKFYASMLPTLLALDFDGVICDGLIEYFATTKKDLSQNLARRFRYYN